MKIGDVFWYFELEVYKSGRAAIARKPTAYVVTSIEPKEYCEWDQESGEFCTVSNLYITLKSDKKEELGGFEKDFNIRGDGDGYIIVYETEQEAIEGWNAAVRDEIDFATHEYEERVGRLKKKLIKNDREK